MIIRKAFFVWQFLAVVLLPAWTLIGWGIFGHGGWGVIGLIIASPVIFITLLAVALIVWARPTVRRERAVSWLDVGMMVVWHGAIIGFGFFGDSASLFAVIGVLAAIAAFWISLWELLTDGARAVRDTLDEFERQAQTLSQQGAQGQGQMPSSSASAPRRDDGGEDVIIVREVRD